MFNLSRMVRSFRYAARGLATVAREEQSFRVQLLAGTCVIVAAFLLPLSVAERIALLVVILLVLVLELMNSIFERFVDIVRPRLHMSAQVIKDIMAATVLVASVGATIIGVIIFWPHIVKVISH